MPAVGTGDGRDDRPSGARGDAVRRGAADDDERERLARAIAAGDGGRADVSVVLGGGAVVPGQLVRQHAETSPPGIMRPVASLIANCMLTKHAPLVVAVKLPPFVVTGTPESDTTPEKVAATW